MENAGKDDIPDEAERKGLGTPATRAAIIEKLVTAGFVERKGKSLIPTKAGINLVTDPAGAADLSHADSGMGTEIDGDRKRRR